MGARRAAWSWRSTGSSSCPFSSSGSARPSTTSFRSIRPSTPAPCSGMSAPPPDPAWVDRTIELAERGRYGVAPNPMVGAVVVRDGRAVAEGFHRRAGEAHAEIEALAAAGGRARGADLYVSLEPCV